MRTVKVFRSVSLAGLALSFGFTLHADDVSFSSPERLQVPDMKELEGAEVVDYDGDGVQDLLSGLYSGNLLFRKNTGSNEDPKYAAPVKLQRGGEDIKLKHW